MTLYDTIIIGGGPSGLSAAIHLAWHNRKILVIDRRTGPLFFTLEKLFNVPGMPEIRGIDIQKNLKAQAEKLGAEIMRGNVVKAEDRENDFLLYGEKSETWKAKTLLLATGVARYHPTVDGDYTPCFKYAGKGNMYYCPDCEAPEIQDKDTIVIGVGPADSASGIAIGLSRYTKRLRILATDGSSVSPRFSEKLKSKNIEVINGVIHELKGKKGVLHSIVLKDGTELPAEAFFVSSPVRGRTDLAQQLGVEMASTGEHMQPKSQRGDTNILGVWIAGDIRPMTQQVSVAMGTGNIAALMIDQYLRKQDIR